MAPKRKPNQQGPIDLKSAITEFKQKEKSLWVPDIMEFTFSDQFLNASVYPRQATLLKMEFLQDELFTQYDYDVIGEWAETFTQEGDNGTQPDILERIRIAKSEKRHWFREWVNVSGRRSGKGYIGAIGAAYVLWHYLVKGSPQAYYGIDPNKQIQMIVFGAKLATARDNLWKDVKNIIVSAPCFEPYIARELTESLTVYAPDDFKRMEAKQRRNSRASIDPTFLIVPKESTVTASRGPATFGQMYDEMAHVVRQVAKNSAAEVYEASTPALDTFGKDAWLYEPSSPYAKDGQFYENWVQALKVSDGTDGHENGHITRPEMFMTQLRSWDTYEDWDHADDIPLIPSDVYDNPTMCPRNGIYRRTIPLNFETKRRPDGDLIRPPQLLDEDMEKLREANPETFAVERLSHWANVMDAYLNEQVVNRIFEPWPDEKALIQQHSGKLSIDYKFHGDPSKSGANFGWSGAHMVWPEGSEFPHVVFDVVSHWEPQDFPDHLIDYDQIEDEIQGYIERFNPTEVTFDQGFSNWLISRLQKWVRQRNLPKRVQVFQRTATSAQNWEVAETFKTAAGLGLVHAPYDELAKQEMLFLQLVNENKVDKPDAGPVQTKDVFDTMSILVHALIGNEIAAFIGRDLGNFRPRGSVQGGMPTQAEVAERTEKTFGALSGWGSRNSTGYMPARGRMGAKSGNRFGRRGW